MSHITTIETTIQLKSEQIIKGALTSLSKEYEGMTFEQVAPDVIKVRYKPIEVYQKNGNLQFIKDAKTGVWKMQLDTWNCAAEVNKVKEAFFQHYRQAADVTFLNSKGYRVNTQRNGKNLVITAVKY